MPDLGVENEAHGEEDHSVISGLYEVLNVGREIARAGLYLDPSDVDEGWRLRPGIVQDVVSVDHHATDVSEKLPGGRRGGKIDCQQTV